MNTAPKSPAWTPQRVLFIVARFAGPCFWCAYVVPAGSRVTFYADEREIAHEECHREACS
jgi:hypothetical protein